MISEVSIAECCRLEVQGGKHLTPEKGAALLNKFFHHPFIARRGVTSRESIFAAKLIRQHEIGACDAIITATAALAGAEVLYTTARRRKAGKLITVGAVTTNGGHVMRIEQPGASQ